MNITPMSIEILDAMGSDISVVNAARVSFHKESDYLSPIDMDTGYSKRSLSSGDEKLISYLAIHDHWTPFAHAFLSFRIKAPIFVARQLGKHQVGLVWNEVSRRYVNEEPEFYFPEVWRGKPVNAKQGSSDIVMPKYYGVLTDPGESPHRVTQYGLVELCLQMYEDMVEQGVAPEQARMVLPQNTMTEWIWSGSLAAFARVCQLRLDSHTQKETQDIAQRIHELIPEELDYSWKALMNGIV